MFWNGERRTPSVSPHNQWFHQFFSILREEVLVSQKRLELRKKIFGHFCVQMTVSILGTIGKCSFEKEQPFLTFFVLVMENCFIEYYAPLEKNTTAAEYINSVLQEWLVFFLLEINLNIFEVYTLPVTLHDDIQLVCISPEVYTYFSLTRIYCPF